MWNSWQSRHVRSGEDKARLVRSADIPRAIEDFQRHAPELVLIDVRPKKCYFADMPFDYLSYFLDDPRFVSIWSNYEKVAELDEAYLYRRTGGRAE